ncbi:hypothetical protein CRE_17505 [Caenorhabditis remanei]|uniref:Uncharacterized protein n=1 Tax=Caenorhabditis remanei TaxID=31234 RepID=E3N7U8_CAERE|nr:hypothetical protein CRE_17505 [Caenorhabditis remanei]
MYNYMWRRFYDKEKLLNRLLIEMGSYRRVDSFEDIHFSDSSPSSESSPERSPSPSSSPPDSPPLGASSAEDDDGIYVRDEDRNKKVVYQEKNSEDETDQEDESEAEQEDEPNTDQRNKSDTESEPESQDDSEPDHQQGDIGNDSNQFYLHKIHFQVLLVHALVSLGQAGIDTENIIRNNTYLIRLRLDQQLKIKQLNHPWLLHNTTRGCCTTCYTGSETETHNGCAHCCANYKGTSLTETDREAQADQFETSEAHKISEGH